MCLPYHIGFLQLKYDYSDDHMVQQGVCSRDIQDKGGQGVGDDMQQRSQVRT